MNKALLALFVVLLCGIAKAQSFTSEINIGNAESKVSQLISIDTTILNQGGINCRHYFVSAEAERLTRRFQHLMNVFQGCVEEHVDFQICAKCLFHIKITQHIECVTAPPYSELLKKIAATEKKREQ